MAYRSLPKFDNSLPVSRFEVARPGLIDGAIRQPGDPIPQGITPRRLRQLYDTRKVRLAPEDKTKAATGREGKTHGRSAH